MKYKIKDPIGYATYCRDRWAADHQHRSAALESMIPDYTLEGILKWITRGHPCGGFISRVLENDLVGASANADGRNVHALGHIGTWLCHYAPQESYGSPDKVQAHFDAHQALRQRDEIARGDAGDDDAE